MGRNLIFFVISNLLFAFLGVKWFGYNSTYVMILLFSLLIFFYGYRRYGLNLTLALIITYQLIFDSDYYSFTSLNLRFWYFLLVFAMCFNVLKKLHIKAAIKRTTNIHSVFINGSILLFGFISLVYLFIDPLSTKIHIIKYWLFYIGLAFFLIQNYKDAIKTDIVGFLDYLISLGAIAGIWGMIQSFFIYKEGVLTVYNNPLTNFEFRPNAFFSETTWYSEYLLFVMIYMIFRIQVSKKYKLIPLLFIPFIGFFLSKTRNTYLALGVFLFLSIVLSIIKARLSMKFFNSIWFYLILLLFVFVIIVFNSEIGEQISYMIYRFTTEDTGTGRLDGFQKGIQLILEKPVFGHGFYWDRSFTTEEGNSYGAKAFNLFMMIAHITGIGGLFIFLFMMLVFYIKGIQVFIYDKSKSEYGRKAIQIITVFFSLSFFAPLHQYPFGMQMVAFSSALLFSNKPLIKNE